MGSLYHLGGNPPGPPPPPAHHTMETQTYAEAGMTPPGARRRPSTDYKRAVMKWKGVKFIRSQSFLAAIEQIVMRAKNNDVIKIGIVGDMGTGKSTLAASIAHAFHARMLSKHRIPYAVRRFGARELANLDGTLRDLAPANYIINFDDVSFMDATTSGKRIAQVKNTLTTIRHRHDGLDVKFCLVYGYHYNRGLDKFLRQTDFMFWTSIGDEEIEYVEAKMHGRTRGANMVRVFRQQYQSAVNTGKWTVRYGKGGKHSYSYRDPFIPLLFGSGGGHIRPIIGPPREFLSEHCHICAIGTGEAADEIEPAVFWRDATETLGPANARQALKLIALENGVSSWPRGVLNAKGAIGAALNRRHVSLHRLLDYVGIEHERPHKRASHDRFVAAIKAAPGRPFKVIEAERKAKQAEAKKQERKAKAAERAATKAAAAAAEQEAAAAVGMPGANR